MPAPKPGERWGILGGAFDPVHFGHLTLARDILDKCGLSGVLFVPTVDPPHRTEKPSASFEDRVTMLELALRDEPKMATSRIEETTPRPSYSLNTVQALKSTYPGVDWVFIVGADIVSQFRTWHCWQELLDEVRILVGHRPGADTAGLSEFPPDRLTLIETSPIAVSSTQIRDRLRAGVNRDELSRVMPVAAADFILARRLYR